MKVLNSLKIFKLIYLILPVVFILSAGNVLNASGSPEKGKNAAQPAPSEQHKVIFKQIDKILHTLDREINNNNNDQKFDSLASVAIDLAESSFSITKTLQVYRKYFELVQASGKKINYASLVVTTEKLALQNPEGIDKTGIWLSISQSASRLNQSVIAQKFALKAFSDAELEKDTRQKVLSYLALGKSFEIQKYYLEAYQNYLNASYLAETLENPKIKNEIQKKCYHHLFEFHRAVDDYDHAAEYKLRHIELIKKTTKLDSIELLWAKYDLCGLNVLSQKYGFVEKTLDELLKEASKKNHTKLKDFIFSLYRKYLIQTDDLAGFHKIYIEKHPEELTRLKLYQPVIYHQIRSKLAEYNNDMGTALLEFEKGRAMISQNTSPAFKSNFFLRYGEFLLNQDKLKEAKNSFLQSYKESEKIDYLDFMLESSYYVDSIAGVLREYDIAYKFSTIHKKLLIRQADINEQDEFLLMELANESKKIELNLKKQEEEQKRTFNLQYFMITLGISFLFLIFLVMSRYKVPEWVIRGLGFFSVLMLFEFIILVLDQKLHHMTHGAPLPIFIIKVSILTFLFPLHHFIEETIIKFMMAKKQIWKPSGKDLKGIAYRLWPWLGNKAH